MVDMPDCQTAPVPGFHPALDEVIEWAAAEISKAHAATLEKLLQYHLMTVRERDATIRRLQCWIAACALLGVLTGWAAGVLVS
jgi:hypothetical protein